MTATPRLAGWNERLLWLLDIQLILIVFTLPVGRIGGSALGLPFSLGGNTYKLFTPFLVTWLAWCWITPRQRLYWGRFVAPLSFFLVTGIVANAGSPYFYETIQWVLKYTLCLAFLIAFINTPWTLRTVRGCTTAFLLGNAYLGLHVFYEILIEGSQRAEGTLGHPNLLGAYLILALPLTLLAAYRIRDLWPARGAYFCAVILFLAAGLTYSRAAYVGIAAVLVVLWLAGRRHTLPQILPLLGVVLILGVFSGGSIHARWSETALDLRGTRPESRIRIWNETYKEVLPNADASGVGTVDQFKTHWWSYQLNAGIDPPTPRFNHAHNIPLHLLVSMGLLGLVFLAWLCIVLLRAVPPWSPSGVWGESGNAAYLLAGAVGFALFGLFDMVIFTKNVTATVVLYLGLIDLIVPKRGQMDAACNFVWGGYQAGNEAFVSGSGSGRPQNSMPDDDHDQKDEKLKEFPDPIDKKIMGSPLKILHLYANYRFTGPSEIALSMAEMAHAKGHQVRIACPMQAPRFRISSKGIAVRRGETAQRSDMYQHVQDSGLDHESRLMLNRHLNIRDNLTDFAVLKRILISGEYDVVHVHQSHDRNLALLAGAFCDRQTAIVASNYRTGSPSRGDIASYLAKRAVDFWFVLSESDRYAIRKELGIEPEYSAVFPGCVDTEIFAPERATNVLRQNLGLSNDALLFGLVARFQPYRRHDIAVHAWSLVAERFPNAHLVLIGRGEHKSEIKRLVKDLNLEHCIHFAGYFEGDSFPCALAALDALIYLRPGSDGSCRTVLQAMSSGVVPITAPVGILPELVHNDRTGIVLETDDPGHLADAVMDLSQNEGKRKDFRKAARIHVRAVHTREAVSERLETAYHYARMCLTARNSTQPRD